MGFMDSFPSSLAPRLAGMANTVKDTLGGLLQGTPLRGLSFFKTKAQPPTIAIAKHESIERRRRKQEQARTKAAMLAKAPDPGSETAANNLPIQANELKLVSSYLLRPSTLNITKSMPANIKEIVERMTQLTDSLISKIGIEPETINKLRTELAKQDVSLMQLLPYGNTLKQILEFHAKAFTSNPAPALA